MMNHVENNLLIEKVFTKSLFWGIIGLPFLNMSSNMSSNMSRDVVDAKEWENSFLKMRFLYNLTYL